MTALWSRGMRAGSESLVCCGQFGSHNGSQFRKQQPGPLTPLRTAQKDSPFGNRWSRVVAKFPVGGQAGNYKRINPLSRIASHGKIHDLPDHLGIGETRFLGSHKKLLPAGKPWIRIRFDYIDLPTARYAHVNAAIIAKLYSAIGLDGDLAEPGRGFFIQVFGDRRLRQLVRFRVLSNFTSWLAIRGTPLGSFERSSSTSGRARAVS